MIHGKDRQSPSSSDDSDSRSQVWIAKLFLMSLAVPFRGYLGPLLLMPHRILLVIVFVPLAYQIFIKKSAGKVYAFDYYMLGSALWAGVALAVNHSIVVALEPFGVYLIEFLGAYFVARVAIRKAQDFISVINFFFVLMLLLLPFALAESILQRPVLLNLLPFKSVDPVYAEPRLGLRRAQTIFAHPILYGVFVSSGFGLIWYTSKTFMTRILRALLIFVSTFLSLSTGALLSLITQLLLVSWESVFKKLSRRWTLFFVTVLFGYLVVDLLSEKSPFHVLVRYASFSSTSAYNRILIWNYGLENVWSHPIFGLGLNDWVRPSWLGYSVDNYWLLMAMQFGIPAFCLCVLALYQILRQIWVAVSTDWRESALKKGYLVSVAGIIIAGGTVHYWQTMMAFVMFVFGSGVCLLHDVRVEDDRQKNTNSLKEQNRTYARNLEKPPKRFKGL